MQQQRLPPTIRQGYFAEDVTACLSAANDQAGCMYAHWWMHFYRWHLSQRLAGTHGLWQQLRMQIKARGNDRSMLTDCATMAAGATPPLCPTEGQGPMAITNSQFVQRSTSLKGSYQHSSKVMLSFCRTNVQSTITELMQAIKNRARR